jgi:hypothetical protein
MTYISRTRNLLIRQSLIVNIMKVKIGLLTGILVALFLNTPLSCTAQKTKKSKDNPYIRTRGVLEPIPVHLSVATSVKFYGVRLGVDYPLRIKESKGFFDFRASRTIRQQYLSADLGAWHYEGVYENVFFNLEYTRRVITEQGLFFQITPIGLGITRTFPSQFVLLKQRVLVDSLPMHQFFVMPSVSLGVGRDFSIQHRRHGSPFIVLAKIGVSALYPNESSIYIFPTAEVSFAYRFSKFTTQVKRTVRH